MELVHHHPHYNQNVDVVTEIVTAILKIVKTRSAKVKQSNRKISNIFSKLFNDNSGFLHLPPPPPLTAWLQCFCLTQQLIHTKTALLE